MTNFNEKYFIYKNDLEREKKKAKIYFCIKKKHLIDQLIHFFFEKL